MLLFEVVICIASIMKIRSILNFVFVLGMVLSAVQVQGDESEESKKFLDCKEEDSCFHKIRVATGIQKRARRNTIEALIAVNYHFRQSAFTTVKDIPIDLVLARISASAAVPVDKPSRWENFPPQFSIELIPVGGEFGNIDELWDLGLAAGGGFLPTRIERNVNLDRKLSVSVSAIAARGGIGLPLDGIGEEDAPKLLIKLAADAIGAKVISHFSTLDKFEGARLLALGAEIGLGKRLFTGVRMSVVIGGSADISFQLREKSGKYGIKRWSPQSDLDAYAEIRTNIAEIIELFIRAGVSKAYLRERYNWTDKSIMMGASFRFF